MELSEVRCLGASPEPYTLPRSPARPRRLLWQTAVRHITEQRFLQEREQERARARGPDEAARKAERHNNGGPRVFPERGGAGAGAGAGLDGAPSHSDFFVRWGAAYRGVIFPTLRTAFKSRDLERLYQRYFLGQRRKSEVVVNVLDVLTKLTLLLLHLGLAAAPMEPVKGTLLGFFTGVEVVICALVVVRKDTTSHTYLQYSGLLTWLAMATQILAAGLGCGLLGDGIGYVLFTLFATYGMLPLPLTWAILAGMLASLLQLGMHALLPRLPPASVNQVPGSARGAADPLPGLGRDWTRGG